LPELSPEELNQRSARRRVRLAYRGAALLAAAFIVTQIPDAPLWKVAIAVAGLALIAVVWFSWGYSRESRAQSLRTGSKPETFTDTLASLVLGD
jgi:O-antigen/teichoic acid export membrane protein